MDNQNPVQTMPLPGQPASQPAPQPISAQPATVQPVQQPTTQPIIQPAAQTIQSTTAPIIQPQLAQPQPVTSTPTTSIEPPHKLDAASLIKTIAIIFLSLTTAIFLGLFIWKQTQYSNARSDVESEIAEAVDSAKADQYEEDLAKFAEDEKYPYQAFSGPADYGQLSFEYPKTWSVYVAADASNGGDFQAYLNPLEVNTVANSTLMALRVTIRDKDFESVAAEYQRAMNARDSNLTMSVITVADTTANLYTGTIPSTEFSGYIVIFKIRDKTAVLQTDSTLFHDDFFNVILGSVEFNA